MKFSTLYQKTFPTLKKIQRKFSQIYEAFLQRAHRGEQVFSIISAILIGVMGAYGAIAFRFLIRFCHWLFFGMYEYSLQLVQNFAWWHRLILPAAGGLLVGPIVYFLAKEVRGSGVPEVMESVSRHGGIIRLRVLFTRTIAAALTIGSGGSAGREGPIVHIGSAIGSAFGQLTGISPKKMRTFVACGAAAGIAATFNAPIAGALFAIEIILGDFAIPQFSPIVISSVTATVLSRHHMGDFPAFQVPQYDLVSSFELIPYSILGILAGIVAVLFVKSLYMTDDFFTQLKIPNYLKPALGGLAVGLIAIKFPEVYGVGYESINKALHGEDVQWILLVLVFAKILATSATLGSGSSGGIFAPSLFVGAMLGALVGDVAHQFFPFKTGGVGAYALVGMGALVAGTT
ncbi:MAG: chloride channel protein, partial [Calditrichia bacterium]